MRPEKTSHQSSAASIDNSICAIVTSRSLSVRSTITPAQSVTKKMGSEPAAATTPTMNALSDSCRASQPCATCCIHVPMSETVCPIQKSRKFRCAWRTRNGFSDRVVGGIQFVD